MLHINIDGVVTCSEITPLADLSRVSLDLFFNSFNTIGEIASFSSQYTVPLLQRQHHNTRKKLKFNKILSVFVDSAAANELSTVNCKYYIKFSTILLKLLGLVETTI